MYTPLKNIYIYIYMCTYIHITTLNCIRFCFII